MAQRGYAQLDYQAHLDPWLPGMIATQYPKAIKTGLFQATGDKTTAVIKFGLGCGRMGAGSVATDTPSNFGEEAGRPVGETDTYIQSSARYGAGGGALVTETIARDRILAGKLDVAANATNVAIEMVNDGANAKPNLIRVGDYLGIGATAGGDFKEIIQIGSITSITSENDMTFTALRGVFETTATSLVANDKVWILGPGNNFAGVCVKDITIDGRWTQDSGDAFMHGDEIPVGVEGDFAVRVCGADEDTDASIKADDLVSIYIGTTTMNTGKNPMIHGSFSNQPNSKDFIVLRGARWTTGNQAVNTYPATFPPGDSGLDNPTKVDVAVARFAGNN